MMKSKRMTKQQKAILSALADGQRLILFADCGAYWQPTGNRPLPAVQARPSTLHKLILAGLVRLNQNEDMSDTVVLAPSVCAGGAV